MTDDEIVEVVRGLRDAGTDVAGVEAKEAAGGVPSNLDRVVSAFANRPGGGVIILGLAESDGFRAVPVWDLKAAQKAAADVARKAVEPSPIVAVSTPVVDGHRLVVVEVSELAAALKPCRVRSTGKAYLRSHDGTDEMSELEIATLIANRGRPGFDRQAVPGATVAGDLDPHLLADFREACRASSASLARFDDDELLLRTGVVTTDGTPTLAGLLALGRYPQQHFPSFVIRASVAPRHSDPPGTRAADVRTFDGPLPTILEEATRWVQRNTRTRVRFGADGHGVDEPEYPATAVRELVANALIHRDLGPHAASYPVSLTLEHNRLVLANPGGLWGVTVDRLGRSGISSARNDALLEIAKNVRTSNGRRVVEGLATGIATVLASLSAAGMVEPEFIDQGVRFAVLLPNHALLAADDLAWLAEVAARSTLSDTQRHALVAMRHGRVWTNSTFREQFPRDSTRARADLQGLVEAGLASAHGERGGRTYTLATTIPGGSPEFDLFDTLAEPTPDEVPPAETAPISRHAAEILDALRAGPVSMQMIITSTGLTRRQVAYGLQRLRHNGVVTVNGRQGLRSTTYELAVANGNEEPTS